MVNALPWLSLIVVCAVPLTCWWQLSRDRISRVSVGSALGACAAGVVLVFAEWTYLTSKVEALFSYPLVAAVLIGLGLGYERHKLGARRRRSGGFRPGGVLLGYFLMVVLCGAPTYLLTNTEASGPNRRLVLPLPGDLKVVNDPRPECGSGACHVWIEVASRRTVPPPQVVRRLREHLTARGWDLSRDTSACRRAGVWFDRTWLCVQVFVDGNRTVIDLEEARGWVGG